MRTHTGSAPPPPLWILNVLYLGAKSCARASRPSIQAPYLLRTASSTTVPCPCNIRVQQGVLDADGIVRVADGGALDLDSLRAARYRLSKAGMSSSLQICPRRQTGWRISTKCIPCQQRRRQGPSSRYSRNWVPIQRRFHIGFLLYYYILRPRHYLYTNCNTDI